MLYTVDMSERMSLEEYFNQPEVKGSRNKFGAKKVEYDGRMFDSKAEAARADQLWMMKLAGEVKEIEYQPVFECIVNGKKVCKYIADFRVTYADGHVEIEDVKGFKRGSAYSYFRLKKKLVEALHGITIIEV